MENKDILLGAITDSVVTYDGSGVVQPGSSPFPGDTSVTDPNTPATPVTPDQPQDNVPETSSTPWMLYLGGAIVFYYLLLKKK